MPKPHRRDQDSFVVELNSLENSSKFFVKEKFLIADP